MSKLFESLHPGRCKLNNRMVMAPMTRSHSDNAGVPSDLVATYYRQRASTGLIITEGTFPSPIGKCYAHALAVSFQ